MIENQDLAAEIEKLKELNLQLKADNDLLLQKIEASKTVISKAAVSNGRKLDRQNILLFGGLSSLILLVVSLNIKAEQKFEYLSGVTDKILDLAPTAIIGGSALLALRVKNNDDEDES
jgi:hypothetical protein